MANPKIIEEIERQANEVEALIRSEGYQILKREYQLLFDNLMKKIRKASKDDKFYGIRGKLDMLETVIKLPGMIIGRRNAV